MIVTCPSCTAKYRVRDDAVPAEGAQLRCPECATMFLAHRPAQHDRELTDAIDRLTKQNHEAETRVRDLEKRLRDVNAEAERQKAEFRRLNEEAGHALSLRDRELADLRAELARRTSDRAELDELKEALINAQKVSGRLTTELDTQRGVIAHLQEELVRARQAQASTQGPTGGAAVDEQVLSLIEAVTPLLWGLDQAVRYLEPFAQREPALAGHVRHLQLLAGVLKRLSDATSTRDPERMS